VSTGAAKDQGPNGQAAQALPAILSRAMTELRSLLTQMRESRDAIRDSASDRLASSHSKLAQVTSATANASTQIMAALEGALAQVDLLEAAEHSNDAAAAAAGRDAIRNTLFDIMGLMQFQDITAQQVAAVQATIADVEARLTAVITSINTPVAPNDCTQAAYYADASLDDQAGRQALADAVLASARNPNA
jgi:chemotaxis regulatin CheY-phosphate phosphatase CheZ